MATTFASLDGGPHDNDPTVGAVEIDGDLTIATGGSITCNDVGSSGASACPINIHVTGNLLMEAGSAIRAENNSGGGNGGNITLDVDGTMTMDGADGTTPGALISARKTSGAGDTGVAGNITITVGDDTTGVGDLFLGGGTTGYGTETGAQIDATGRGASGDIDITVAGNYFSEPGSVVSSGGLNGTSIQQGGKIFIVVGCALTSQGRITSKGPDPGGDLVHLEACDILIQGLVESTGKGHTVAANPNQINVAPFNSCDGFSDVSVQNEIVRDGKPGRATGCIEVWANNIMIDSTLPWAGELNADIGNGGSQGMGWIDIFAKSSLIVTDGTGNDRISNNLGHTYLSTYAVHANAISGSDHSPGIVTALVDDGPLTASGKAFQAFTTGAGSDGGMVRLEASGQVTLDTAFVNATGDFNPNGGVGLGGHIFVASWLDDISWQNGDGDVRPATGDITLNVCVPGTITTTGTNFHGEIPITPGACDPDGPDLPTTYDVFNEAAWALCTPGNGTKSGHKYEDENANGNDDGAGDANLSGWRIWAIADTGVTPGELEASEVTAAVNASSFYDTDLVTGAYTFSLPAGNYFICEEAQKTGETGWLQSSPRTGDTDFTDKCDDQNATANPDLAAGGYYITLAADEVDAGNEFGNYKNGTKSGHKYNDVDGNTNDNDEANLDGWRIWAIADTGATPGQLEASEVTAAVTASSFYDTDLVTGAYTFSLAPGNYFICEETQTGWNQTSPQVGDTDFTTECGDQNGTAEPDLATGGYYITVTSQSTDTNNEFGNRQPPGNGNGTKSGHKYEDENANGNDDGAGDANLSGWRIWAIADTGVTPGELEASEVTAAVNASSFYDTDLVTGAYTFSLPAGNYFICEEAQKTGETGWLQSSPRTGDTDFTDKCDDQNATANPDLAAGGYYITLAADEVDAGNEFGNYKNGTKSGHKYNDVDGNTNDNDEANLDGWRIWAIADTGATPGQLEASEVTAAVTASSFYDTDLVTGAYTFSLAPGNYFICEETQTGWNQTSPQVGDTDFTTECGDQNGTAEPDLATGGYYITVTSQSTDTNNEFGNRQPPTTTGQIAPTATTCPTFVAGTSDDLTEIEYSVKDGVISQLNPGVFFYYTTVTAPASSFTIDIVQSGTHPTFSTLFDVQNLSQIRLFNAACEPVDATVSIPSAGQARILVTGATVGQVFIVSVKYDKQALEGEEPPTDPSTAHYNFVTNVDGTQVDADPDGLDLTPKT